MLLVSTTILDFYQVNCRNCTILVCVCAYLPNPNQEDEELLSSARLVSVEKVVVPSLSMYGSEIGGGGRGVSSISSVGRAADRPPPPPPPMLGKRPPAVGGAVTSWAACSYDSAVGTGGAIILVNMIPIPDKCSDSDSDN
jgi:hypothetical protein